MSSVLGRLKDRLGRTVEELEADELQATTGRLGVTRIADAKDREVAEICGVLRSLTLPPRTTAPALIGELYDGSGAINVIWLGRRAIGGIEPGTPVRVRGRVCIRQGVPTIFNPTYEILPKGGVTVTEDR